MEPLVKTLVMASANSGATDRNVILSSFFDLFIVRRKIHGLFSGRGIFNK